MRLPFVNRKNMVRRPLRWLHRFRHRRGYGIHSPFAYNFVANVIYERGAYYAYPALRRQFLAAPAPLLREKDYRLLFRLANHRHPRLCAVLGLDALALEYLKAAVPTCRFIALPAEAEADKWAEALQGGRCDMVFAENIACKALPSMLRQRGDAFVLVAGGVHGKGRKAWQDFIGQKAVRVTFDLYDFGIAFFEERLNKQDYIINYY